MIMTKLLHWKTATWIFLYILSICYIVILNVYINLYHKLPSSYYLITYYQWAHSIVKSATELSAEWRTLRIAASICCGDVILLSRNFFHKLRFDNILVQSSHEAFKITRLLKLCQDQAAFRRISADPRLLQVASQWTALLLRIHIRMQDLRHCLIRLLVHL